MRRGDPSGAPLGTSPQRTVRTERSTCPNDDSDDVLVRARSGGSVQFVQWEQLVAWAANNDVRIDVVAIPGTSVIAGDPVLRITGSGPVRDDTDDSRFAGLLKSSVVFGAARTPHQDIDFALQQLVEIGVRGLASGTNDPCTAVNALELSATALVPLWGSRTAITAYTDDDGTVRVTPHWPSPRPSSTASSTCSPTGAKSRSSWPRPAVSQSASRRSHRRNAGHTSGPSSSECGPRRLDTDRGLASG